MMLPYDDCSVVMLPAIKKDCQGELQHAWLTNSAHYPVCTLLSVVRTGVGGWGSVRLPETSARRGGEASTNSVSFREGATGAAGERDWDKAPWALPLRLGWRREGRPSAEPWRGSFLAWKRKRRGCSRAGRPSSHKPLLWLDLFNSTVWDVLLHCLKKCVHLHPNVSLTHDSSFKRWL